MYELKKFIFIFIYLLLNISIFPARHRCPADLGDGSPTCPACRDGAMMGQGILLRGWKKNYPIRPRSTPLPSLMKYGWLLDLIIVQCKSLMVNFILQNSPFSSFYLFIILAGIIRNQVTYC